MKRNGNPPPLPPYQKRESWLVERGTIFDELERIEQIPRACQLDAIPLGEIQTASAARASPSR